MRFFFVCLWEKGERSSPHCPPPVLSPALGRSFCWTVTCAKSSKVSHSGVGTLPGLEGSTAVLSYPIVVALWVDSERTPLGDRKKHPWCCQRPHPKFQWALSKYCVLVQTGKKIRGLFICNCLPGGFFFLIFILIRDTETLNILNTNL